MYRTPGKTKTSAEKERIFVEAFSSSFDPVKSAILAGYAAKSASVRASEMLSRDSIQKALRKRLKLTLKKQNLSPEYVLTGLREVFERCMQLKNVTNAKGKKIGVYRFEPRAALKALELLGRNYDMFSPDVIVNLQVEIDSKLNESRQRALKLIESTEQLKDITDEVRALEKKSKKKPSSNESTINKPDTRLV